MLYTNSIKKLIVANWKMHGNIALCKDMLQSMLTNSVINFDTILSDGNRIQGVHVLNGTENTRCLERGLEIVICPPFTLLREAKEVIDTYVMVSKQRCIMLGAQNCNQYDNGSYTGEISARMLSDCGCSYVIIGHSERRLHYNESDDVISQKIHQALKHGLIPIVCVGEPCGVMRAGETYNFLATQLLPLIHFIDKDPTSIIIAYEPIWAIGSGEIPDIETIVNVNKFIKMKLHTSVSVLYGGSVTVENSFYIAQAQGIDGVLVGRASLSSLEFTKICQQFDVRAQSI